VSDAQSVTPSQRSGCSCSIGGDADRGAVPLGLFLLAFGYRRPNLRPNSQPRTARRRRSASVSCTFRPPSFSLRLSRGGLKRARSRIGAGREGLGS
jgi:MYXO-CTERM domain-containing protein